MEAEQLKNILEVATEVTEHTDFLNNPKSLWQILQSGGSFFFSSSLEELQDEDDCEESDPLPPSFRFGSLWAGDRVSQTDSALISISTCALPSVCVKLACDSSFAFKFITHFSHSLQLLH